MADKRMGVFGASSSVGLCALSLLEQNGWQTVAYTRHQIETEIQQKYPTASWRQLEHHSNPVKIGKFEMNDKQIASWLYLAPIWTLPSYLNFLAAQGAQRIVVLSSTSVFTKEDSSDCAERMLARRLANGEAALRTWAEKNGITWIILRPTLIYGQGRDRNITEIARFIRKFRFFPLLGSANGLRQPVHVEDVAAACLAAFLTSSVVNRAYNICGGEILTYREMVIRIFKALNQPVRLLTVPRWFFNLAVLTLRQLPRYRHWTTAMAERMNRNLVFDCSEAARDFDYAPRRFVLMKEDLP